MSPAPSAADTSVALSAHIHALAGAHLASALPPSSPPSTLTHILKLALDDATPSLSLETLLSLSLLCPWEACPPLASLYTRASPSSAVLADAASALLATTPAVPSDKLALLLHAFLKLSPKPAASSPIAQTLRDHADLPRTLRRLSETYPTLPIPHALHLLHALALLGPENLPSPSVLLAELPAEFNDPPAPFTSLWADYQTLFDLSSKVLERGGDWGDVAIRLLGLEGGRAAWEKEALRRERALEPEVVNIAPASTAAASVTGVRIITILSLGRFCRELTRLLIPVLAWTLRAPPFLNSTKPRPCPRSNRSSLISLRPSSSQRSPTRRSPLPMQASQRSGSSRLSWRGLFLGSYNLCSKVAAMLRNRV